MTYVFCLPNSNQAGFVLCNNQNCVSSRRMIVCSRDFGDSLGANAGHMAVRDREASDRDACFVCAGQDGGCLAP